MQEVSEQIEGWFREEETVGLATVVQTWGSAPRKMGAKMAITPDGKIAGSVSGGCVEGAVFEQAVEAIEAGQGKLLQFGVADETAWEVGLACGGNIKVFVENLDREIFAATQSIVANDKIGAMGTIIESPDPTLVGKKFVIDKTDLLAGWGSPEAIEAARDIMRKGKSSHTELSDGSQLFVELFLPTAQLIMVGGVHIAVALVEYAKVLGYKTIVIDPRRAFGSDERFPDVEQLIQKWPDKGFDEVQINENTAVALLTHDPKIDDPALNRVLRSPAFYIGALGSRKTHAKRVARLEAAGFTAEEIGKIYGPIGLDISAQTPEEIALSVMAEIVKARRSGPSV